MADERDFKIKDWIKEPTVINTTKDNFGQPIIRNGILNKVRTFSKLITDKTLKESFDEYFKEYL